MRPLLLVGLLLVSLVSCADGADPIDASAGESRKAAKSPKWTVRTEVLMVAMDEAKALALLPELKDEKRVDEAVEKIMQAIQRKEATLLGYPVVQTLDRERAVTESIFEQRYPTEFEAPKAPDNNAQADPKKENLIDADLVTPTAFETRNTGVTFEVEPRVSSSGEWIRLNVVPQRVVLNGWEASDVFKKGAKVGQIKQPQFFVSKTTTSVVLRSGAHVLLAVHKLPAPESQLELVILQAEAKRIGK